MAASTVLQALQDEVERTRAIEASAVTLINGIAGRIQAGIDAALAGGATAAQLEPVQNEVNDLRASSDALAAAVEANTTPTAAGSGSTGPVGGTEPPSGEPPSSPISTSKRRG